MSKTFKTILFFFILTSVAHAAAPVLLYSDLTSGPQTGGVNNKGVFVTIWGKNFGSSQGGSTVAINGGNVDNYPTWSDTMICFQLGSSPSTGNIVVTVGGVASNGIPFTIRSGNIYFVDPNAVTNGTGTVTSPWFHLHYAYAVIIAGDTVYVRAGTIYDEYNGDSGWHSILAMDKAGTSGSPMAWVAYPNETVTLTADAGTSTWPDGADQIVYIFRSTGTGNYQTFSKFNMVFTGSNNNLQSEVGGSAGWRIVGNNLTASFYSFGLIDAGGANLEILGNEIHDSGANIVSGNEEHAIYIDGPSSPFEIGWNYLHGDKNTGWEISCYHNGPRIGTMHDNKIVASTAGDIKGILADGAGDSSSGHGIGDPDTYSTMYTNNVKVYNNILVNLGKSENGGVLQGACGTNTIYNNTIYGSGTENLGMTQFYNTTSGFQCGPGGADQVINFSNNILYGNVSGLYISDSNGNAPTWADFTISKNIYFGEGNGPTQDTTAINSDPKFTTNFTDFHLQATSPAIGAGLNTNSVVATDYDGITRPNPPAIGAYEYAAGGGGGGGSAGTGDVFSKLTFKNLILR